MNNFLGVVENYLPSRKEIGAPPDEYFALQFSNDITYKEEEDTMEYKVGVRNDTVYWAEMLNGNVIYRVTDLLLTPLTGIDTRLSGYLWSSGVSLAADRSLEQYSPERALITVEDCENELWEREIEDAEWHEIAETVLEASSDIGALDPKFANGADSFIHENR